MLTPPVFKETPDQIKAQDLLTSDATHIALGGGGRSGKTFKFVRSLILRSQLAPGSRHAMFRFRANAIDRSVVQDTFPKVMKTCFPKGFYNPKNWTKSPNVFYRFHNESEIWFAGLDDKDRVEAVLGQEFATLYYNECSQIPWASVALAKSRLAQKCVVPAGKNTSERLLTLKCYYDFNPPSKRHWTYRYFIERLDPETRKLLNDPMDINFMLMNPEGNMENLSPEYLAILNDLPLKSRKRFLLGLFADDDDGALWTDELFHQNRVLATVNKPLPKWIRIVIAVDPSGCSGEEDYRSDEVGIAVVALGTDGCGYVLEDLSGRYGPAEWGELVNKTYERHGADRIVAEKNYGGAMVENTILAINPKLPVTMVNATRGKVVRAEPISALYDKELIYHVGYFPELEDQLCDFTVVGYQGMKSPDRADAVIWGITELFPGIAEKAVDDQWTPPNVKTRKRSSGRYGE